MTQQLIDEIFNKITEHNIEELSDLMLSMSLSEDEIFNEIQTFVENATHETDTLTVTEGSTNDDGSVNFELDNVTPSLYFGMVLQGRRYNPAESNFQTMWNDGVIQALRAMIKDEEQITNPSTTKTEDDE